MSLGWFYFPGELLNFDEFTVNTNLRFSVLYCSHVSVFA